MVLDVRRALAEALARERWGRWRSSRARRSRPPGLEVADHERDQSPAGRRCASRRRRTTRRSRGRASARAGGRRRSSVDGDRRSDCPCRRRTRARREAAAPAHRARSGSSARIRGGSRPERGPRSDAGGELAQHLGHGFTDPSPGTNGGLWKNGTRFSQSRGAWRWIRTSPATASAGSGAARGRGSASVSGLRRSGERAKNGRARPR